MKDLTPEEIELCGMEWHELIQEVKRLRKIIKENCPDHDKEYPRNPPPGPPNEGSCEW
jgi:hypothetical protein